LDAGGWGFSYVGELLEATGIWGDPFWEVARRTAVPLPALPTPAPSLPDVISEIPQGWETVIIGGEERLVVPDEIGAGPEPVLEAFDPGAVIGEVQGADTVAQSEIEEEPMAHDWGHLIRQGAESIFGLGGNGAALPAAYMGAGTTPAIAATTLTGSGAGGGGDCDGMTWSGGAPPKGYKVVRDSCGNGILRKVRRRRRRRMLTSGDKDDIASIVSMVGKGQMAAALINGSMRRG